MIPLTYSCSFLGAVLTLSALCVAYAYPPLPKVERYRLTDEQFFEALDSEHPGMAQVLATLKADGVEAGKAALAKHFRERTEPKWLIDSHGRPQHASRPEGVNTSKADAALKHVFHSHGVTHQFGEDIAWLDNPTYAEEYEFDKEWSMSFVRMPWWEDLGKAYWATGEEKYAQEFVRQYLDFTKKHRIPLKRTGGAKHPLKYAVPEWRTLEIAIRLNGSWTNSFYRFLTSPSFDDNTLCEMLKSFWEMAHHLLKFSSLGKYSSNWAVAETKALHIAGILFPEFRESHEWLSAAEERLTTELEKQVYPDGVQWELAPGYGAGVLRSFRSAHEFGKLNGRPMPDAYVARLENYYNYYLHSSVNGQMAAFGDSGHGSVRSLLAMGCTDFPHRLDFEWVATSGREGEVPKELAYAFPYAGQYVMRSGWEKDDRFMILDAGPYGIAHQNEDNLNFELFAYGDWLIEDPGYYRYNYDSPWRHFMVSSLSHNTLIVDHQGQCRRQKRETWVAEEPMPHTWMPGEEMTYFRGAYEHGYGDKGGIRVKHTRSIFFLDGRFWVIIDRAVPEDEREHLYEALFMLNAPDAVAEGNRIVTRRDGPNLLIVAADSEGQTVSVVKGQMAPVRRGWKRGGKTVVPNPTAVIAQRKSGPAALAMVLYPLPPGEEAPEIKVIFAEASGGEQAVALRIVLPDGSQRLVVDQLGEGEVTVKGLAPLTTPAARGL